MKRHAETDRLYHCPEAGCRYQEKSGLTRKDKLRLHLRIAHGTNTSHHQKPVEFPIAITDIDNSSMPRSLTSQERISGHILPVEASENITMVKDATFSDGREERVYNRWPVTLQYPPYERLGAKQSSHAVTTKNIKVGKKF